MVKCPTCGHSMERSRRSLVGKLLYRAVLVCPYCKAEYPLRRPTWNVFARYAHCPDCGTTELSKLAGRDRVDRTSHNPFRFALILLGRPLYHCAFCRVQFRDWRKRESDAHR